MAEFESVVDYSTKLKIGIEEFDGPLDLLLHLIKEAKIEIKDIFVSEVTKQFLEYMDGLDVLDVNERAHKCYLKCGFKDTGKDRERVFLNGKYYDMLHMDILENEFAGDYIRNKNVR